MKQKASTRVTVTRTNIEGLHDSKGVVSPSAGAWPILYRENNIVSGLITLSDKERYLLKGDTKLGKELCEFLKTLLAKVAINFTNPGDKTVKEVLDNGFKNVFGLVDSLEMSPELEAVIGHKIVSLIQHFIVMYWNDRCITFEELKDFVKSEINCNTYQEAKIVILAFIEIAIARYPKKLISQINPAQINYHLINPEGLEKVLPISFSETDPLTQTGQKYADLLLIKDAQTTNPEKYYYDVKSYSTFGVKYRLLSVYHNKLKSFPQIVGDILSSRYKHTTKTPEIWALYKRILTIKNKGRLEEQRYNEILREVILSLFDKRYEELKISISIDAGEDKLFEIICNNQEFQQKIKESQHSLEDLFPKKSILDKEKNEQAMREQLEAIIPDNMQKGVSDHFNNVISGYIKDV
jgi:hypothetical protein